VALGNFLFNTITAVILFFLLRPVNYFITEGLQIKDNLIALVFFQSLVNLGCILLFFPILKPFGKFLMSRFSDRQDESFYISKVSVHDASLAVEALENETKHFFSHVIDYSLESFNLKESIKPGQTAQKGFHSKTVTEKYDYIKQLHGEMHGFYLKVQKTSMAKDETERLNQLIAAIRNGMYAAKNIRDAQHDILQMSNSSNDIKYSFYTLAREKLLNFYQRVQLLLDKEKGTSHFDELTAVYQSITKGYSETLQSLYKESLARHVSEQEISTLLNFNRELYTSFKSLLFGLKDYLLTSKEADYFDALPGFIR
jgi:phosphate:Na+ symporter